MQTKSASAYKLLTTSALALGLALAVVPASNAALITNVTITDPKTGESVTGSPFEGNDCSGLLGQGFSSCEYAGSPIIIKFNPDGSVSEINSGDFSTISGVEFTFDFTNETWWYTPNQEDDPLITHYAAKGGNYFNLYSADDSDCSLGGAAQCGVWSTTDPAIGGLSHLSFYDSEGGDTGDELPEPGVLFLMGAGLLGLGMARRRKSA